MTSDQIERALDENAELIHNLDNDLSRMPAFKQGTRWETDRTRARAGLVERRERLRGQLRQMAECN